MRIIGTNPLRINCWGELSPNQFVAPVRTACQNHCGASNLAGDLVATVVFRLAVDRPTLENNPGFTGWPALWTTGVPEV